MDDHATKRRRLEHGKELDQESVLNFLNNFDHFIFDCDGVLWRGQDTSIPKADQFISLLRKLVKL
jgi:hypothetical protein